MAYNSNIFKERDKQYRKLKTYKGEFYTINSLFGNDWAKWFILLGGREAGKSYAVMKWAVLNKLRKKDKFKLYWFRLTEVSQRKLLASGGRDMIDADIAKKYNIKTKTRKNRIYTYKEKERVTKTGKVVKEEYDVEEFATVMACSTFYNDKGVGYFDCTYEGEYLIVLDEMNREACGANRFDIVYAFCNQLENVIRSVHNRVRIVCIGNTLDEASDILSAFNFIPDKFGRYKIKNKKFKAVIDYIAGNEAYKARREKALSSALISDSSTFTNEVTIDRSLLVNKRRCTTPEFIIKFDRTKSKWFTIWNGNIIKPYNGENCSTIAMKKYIDDVYDADKAKSVKLRFDARAFKFTNVSVFKTFQKYLRLLKPNN